jgi:hypothetical protein
LLVLRSIAAGLGRTLGAPGMVLLIWMVGVVVALPAAVAMTSNLDDSFGGSLTADRMAGGFHMAWWWEHEAQADAFEKTFRPSIVGVGAMLDNLESWLTGELFARAAVLVALGLVYVLVWSFLLGGVLARFNGGDERMLAAGGRYFFRFARLAILSAALYWLVYRLNRRLYVWVIESTREATAESTVLGYSLVAFGVTALLLILIHVSFGYAKVAVVVDGRVSMLGAALRGIGFTLAHPLRTFALCLFFGVAGVLGLALYAWVAPGAGSSTFGGLLYAFLLGQLFLIGRLVLHLSLLGSQLELYRQERRI